MLTNAFVLIPLSCKHPLEKVNQDLSPIVITKHSRESTTLNKNMQLRG